MQTASSSAFAPAQPQGTILKVQNAKSYPNPFNPFYTDATISFEITQSARVQIHIYDWAGEFVNTLDLGTLPQGQNSALWGGQTQDGRKLGNGTYLARVVASTQARQESQVVKVVVWNEK
jgi:flagellar hook assembly protein FlgD